MISRSISYLLILSIFVVLGCKSEPKKDVSITASDYHQVVESLTDCIVNDIFSPPVAARIYSYPNLAAWYTLNTAENDLGKFLNDGPNDISIQFSSDKEKELTALLSFVEVGRSLVFTTNHLDKYEESLKKSHSSEIFNPAKEHSLKISKLILDYASTDFYKESRTLPKTNLKHEKGKWTPTPPDFMDGVEPHWNKIRPFYLDSASQFVPIPPPPFDIDKSSDFGKELNALYEVTTKLSDKEVEIAKFWDCNPYVALHQGHYMEGVKKITPGGHWIGITGLSCRKAKLDFKNTCYTYSVVSTSLHDAFVSCWDEKYRSKLIRPETAINLHIDPDWKPILTTPPFPEYTSGHSVVSGAASVVLSNLFGDEFSFIDSTELKYGLPIRKYDNFAQAASEAAISRLYGGIHYQFAIDEGLEQGKEIGAFISTKLSL